jgi:hypothetical protein
VLGVVAGTLPASAAYFVFLRSYPPSLVELGRRLSPILATCVIAIVGVAFVVYVALYRSSV